VGHDAIPPIECVPPYSIDFVTHLHGGCYSGDVTPSLLSAVRADPDGMRMLEALILVQVALGLAAPTG
jgi:hypothetical protein